MVNETNSSTPYNGQSQVRKHYYLDQFVVIAPRRHKRPRRADPEEVISQKPEPRHPIEDQPGLYQVEDEGGHNWQIKVVENAYPAFTPDNDLARGRQELVLETPEANRPFYELSVPQIEAVLGAYQARTTALMQQYGYVSVFKNHGSAAGASLDHTHSQIIATELIPSQVVYEREALAEYVQTYGSSPLCDVIRWELTNKERVIAHTRYTTTICPYASQFPLEAWIIPNRQVHSLAELNPEEVHSLADHLKGIAIALAGSNIDFNYHVCEPMPDTANHCFFKITPRLSLPGGFEYNTGIYMNTVSPEFATGWYQKHVKTPDAV